MAVLTSSVPPGSIAETNADQGKWLTQKVAPEDTGYGGRSY